MGRKLAYQPRLVSSTRAAASTLPRQKSAPALLQCRCEQLTFPAACSFTCSGVRDRFISTTAPMKELSSPSSCMQHTRGTRRMMLLRVATIVIRRTGFLCRTLQRSPLTLSRSIVHVFFHASLADMS